MKMLRLVWATPVLLISALMWFIALYTTRYDYGWIIHLSCFFFWTVSWNWFSWKINHHFNLIIPLLTAGATEVIQLWIPGHTPEWAGLFWSIIGVILGFLTSKIWLPKT